MIKNIKTFLYKKASFKHGGLLHNDEVINDLLVIHPHLIREVPPIKYERSLQKFWLKLFRLVEKI